MPRSVTPRTLLLIGLAIAIIINTLLFGGHLTAWIADGSGQVLAPIMNRVTAARVWATTVLLRGNLATDNALLREEVVRLTAQLANQEELQRDISFYRDAVGIRERLGSNPMSAGIFSYPQAGGVRQATINRGSADGVVVNDTVVTAAGALVGSVTRLFEHHATVTMIGDIALEATVRVMNTEVTGLLHTAADGTVLMDLVQKNETVTEQSIVVTSGDDFYPAGYIVGVVRSVDNDATTLFKTVRITPAVARTISGNVIIVRP